MHASAMKNGKDFFDVYSGNLDSGIVLDIGSQDVNGSLREVCPKKLAYIGVDFVAGKGVDVLLKEPYSLPFPDNHADIVLASSCFEHSELFWVLFLEILRVLKPSGIFYLQVPSNGMFHRYPVDCWRFYPDSGKALVAWAVRHKIDASLLESFTSDQCGGDFLGAGGWNDFVAVFIKDKSRSHLYAKRISDARNDIRNIWTDKSTKLEKYCIHPQDKEIILNLWGFCLLRLRYYLEHPLEVLNWVKRKLGGK